MQEETRRCFYCGFTGLISEFLCFEVGDSESVCSSYYGRCRSCADVSGSIWSSPVKVDNFPSSRALLYDNGRYSLRAIPC